MLQFEKCVTVLFGEKKTFQEIVDFDPFWSGDNYFLKSNLGQI